MKAVVLAGGVGTRLRPYTVSLPKPLMPVGNRPILEILIDQLKASGVSEIVIAVGYLESLIRAYFGDGSSFGVEITYSSEKEPLGTAGPLNQLRSQLADETFFLMNGDVLSDVDYAALRRHHVESGGIATVALMERKVNIDFGVVKIDSCGKFLRWQEKPTLGYHVSMGIYVMEPCVLDHVPNGFFNLPDLIVRLHESDQPVHGYQHDGFWLDIGRPDDYVKACQLVENGECTFV